MRRARVRCALGVIAALGLALGASTAHTQSEAPLTDSELRNATYPSEFTADGVATLRDGEFRGPAAPDRLGGGFAATAVDSTVISDGAAVVVLRVTGSGSATWYVLYAATRVGGVATPGPPVLLGDNAQVVSLGLGQGRVRVEFRTFAPGDSHCCPSRIAVREYARSGNVLTLAAASEQATPTPPDGVAAPARPASSAGPEVGVPAATTAAATSAANIVPPRTGTGGPGGESTRMATAFAAFAAAAATLGALLARRQRA